MCDVHVHDHTRFAISLAISLPAAFSYQSIGPQMMAGLCTPYTLFAITSLLAATLHCGMTAAAVNTTSPPSPILLSR